MFCLGSPSHRLFFGISFWFFHTALSVPRCLKTLTPGLIEGQREAVTLPWPCQPGLDPALPSTSRLLLWPRSVCVHRH